MGWGDTASKPSRHAETGLTLRKCRPPGRTQQAYGSRWAESGRTSEMVSSNKHEDGGPERGLGFPKATQRVKGGRVRTMSGGLLSPGPGLGPAVGREGSTTVRTVAKPGQAPTGSGSKSDCCSCSSHTLPRFVPGWARLLSTHGGAVVGEEEFLPGASGKPALQAF